MSGAFRSMRSAGRILGFVGALAAVLSVLPEAAAAKPSRSELSPVPGGVDADASGRVRMASRRAGDRVRLVLRDLEPRTGYEVRDAATRAVLAAFTTNGRGRGKASFRSASIPGGGSVSLAGLPVEVCRAGEDAPVLGGTLPDGDGGSDRPSWNEFTFRVGEVSTAPDAAVQVSLVVTSTTGPGMDGSWDSMSVFVAPGGVGTKGREDDDGGASAIPSPVVLRITDAEGVLRDVAELDCGIPYDCLGLPGADAGRTAKHMAGSGLGGMVEGGFPGDASIVPCEYFWWWADNAGDPGLPFGAGSVDDLVGRAFEVRDGEGTLLLGGEIPALETIPLPEPPPPDDFRYEAGWVGTGPDAPMAVSVTLTSMSGGGMDPYDSIQVTVTANAVFLTGVPGASGSFREIPEPFGFWIEDDRGALVRVGVLEATVGDVFAMYVPDGPIDFPPFHWWSADNVSGDGLPFGVDRVRELSGRDFEVRDAEGGVIFGGVLPELEETWGYEPLPEGGPGRPESR